MVYIVTVENLTRKFKGVSQEAYSTLEKAHKFCMSRSGTVEKVDNYHFVDWDADTGYEINEVSVV